MSGGARGLWSCGAAVVVAGCAGALAPPAVPAPVAETERHAVGAGAYVTALPAGEKPPSNARGEPVRPKVVEGFDRPPPTNDWWSSLIWQFDRGGKPNPYSEPLFAHPLALQARPDGLGVGYPSEPRVEARSFFYPYVEDLVVGLEGLDAADARVAGYGDWTVTARWSGRRAGAGAGAAPRLLATFGHGLPFVYAEAERGRPRVALGTGAEARVFAEAAGALGLTVRGHHYGLFLPGAARWARAAGGFAAEAATPYFSIAVLPDDRAATLALFRRHAFSFVTDSRVSWRYDAAAATVVTELALSTEPREPGAAGGRPPLVALYPHQWKRTSADLRAESYASPRGPMRLAALARFATRTRFFGILPVLPLLAGGVLDRGKLADLVRAAARADELFPAGLENTKGTYWIGKSLQRVALLAWLAEAAGERDTRARLVAALATRLESWLDGRAPDYFYYDDVWRTLVGVPSEYKSGWELNDHHFHYAYFLFAAATVARFDPAWAGVGRWGGMMTLLLRDAANPDREDRRFPFLRHFDPYAGHSWANGPALFAEGNNEESSSEEVNLAVAAFLWGAITGDVGARDLGLFLYTNATAAIADYWFDVDRQTFPPAFKHPAVAMVWGSGGKYDTWWDRNPAYVHGINLLPFTGGSLYLGHRPDYVRRNLDGLTAANHGEPVVWRDILWMFRALADPQGAIARYEQSPHLELEFGSSAAFLYHWLYGLADLGQVDTTVTADAPTYAVFKKGGTRQHVAWSPERRPVAVTFSDGVVVQVPAGAMGVVARPAGAGP